MRLARIQTADGPRHAVVVDEEVHLLAGSYEDQRPGWDRRTGEVVPLGSAHLLAPTVPSAVYAVGRNYAAHAAEMGFELTKQPSVFMKPVACILDPGGDVVLPPADMSSSVEHEAELVVVIGRTARNVRAEDALHYVLGYTCGDDVSARDIQRSDTHIVRAKGFDTFGPVGPWIETDVDTASLAVRCFVNGELRQDGSTSDLLFKVPTLVESISAWTTLRPGDLIMTGSPAGTTELHHGDVVEIDIEGIGRLVHGVVATDPQ